MDRQALAENVEAQNDMIQQERARRFGVSRHCLWYNLQQLKISRKKTCPGHRYGSYQNDHPDLDIPYKRSKHHQLTEEEKEYNSALSSIRVRAEHAIRRIKIFCICSEKFRYPRSSHSTKFAIVAGIANLVAGF